VNASGVPATCPPHVCKAPKIGTVAADFRQSLMAGAEHGQDDERFRSLVVARSNRNTGPWSTDRAPGWRRPGAGSWAADDLAMLRVNLSAYANARFLTGATARRASRSKF